MSVPKWHFLYGSRRDRRSREILLWGEARKKNTIFNAQKMTFVLVYLVLLHLLGARVYVLPQEGSALSSGKGHSPYPRDLSRTL